MSNTKDKPMDGKKKVSRFEFAIMQAAGIDQTNVEPKTEEEEIQERLNNLKNQSSRIRIKNHSGSYIPTKETPMEETAQALRDKFREKNKECESLKLELQKQKELKDELVKVVTDINNEYTLFNKRISDKNIYAIKSLIKKSSEI